MNLWKRKRKKKKSEQIFLLFFPQFCGMIITCTDVIHNPVSLFLKLCPLKGNFVIRPVNIQGSKRLINGITNYRGIRSIRPPEPSLWNIFEFIPWYFSMLLINNHMMYLFLFSLTTKKKNYNYQICCSIFFYPPEQRRLSLRLEICYI